MVDVVVADAIGPAAVEAGVADALIGAAAAGVSAAVGIAAAIPAHARAVATALIGPAGVAGIAWPAGPVLADLIGIAALAALAAMARVRLEIDAGVLVAAGFAPGQARIARLRVMAGAVSVRCSGRIGRLGMPATPG